ncbi:cytochrome-c peroxidase [Bacteriovorax sp. Seq25_V]|uniref:cytochrome-c peroxidase n=1 Tax=Bacteriovorax sp. Seq25_V TaxID=1201288 RepID=UPI00038A46FE|nr:cytochrome c peroxidase [Bacteriovorax sp. Seq25_V]EQC44403.1 di-heme cytochrome C peroxidase [Bacteriovorax sp. Seq25_V]
MRTLFLLFIATVTFANNTLDTELDRYIKKFNFKAVTIPSGKNSKIYALGEALFFEEAISGNKNISCATCHDPNFGTSDALPTSIGEGGYGLGNKRVATNSEQIVPRNSPGLFNVGSDELSFMFWDGRVHYSKRRLEFTTPEPGLNGDYPEFYEIVDELDSVLAAQALFPITSHAEMRGLPGTNELANTNSNLELWEAVMKRLMAMPKYQKLFKEAFNIADLSKFNIGHFGRALGHYQKFAFVIAQTPWDKYLRGDKGALSNDEKKGAIAFATSGLCANCHNGELLGGIGFFNVVAPQTGPGKDIKHNDEGLFLTTGTDQHKYLFRTPMLRNVSKTAPYFHSGAYSTLEQVIEHYSTGPNAIDNYDFKILEPFEKNNYKEQLFVETDRYMLFKKKNTAHPLIKSHMIRLTSEEKRLIALFLRKSLTE